MQVATAQKPTLNQIWIGEELQYLHFDSTHVLFDFPGKYGQQDKKGYHIIGDTLRLQDWFRSSSDNYKTMQQKNYDFIIHAKSDSITLKPLNDNALSLARSNSTITYKPIQSIYKKTFEYDSLRFTATNCYGYCPEMTLVIKGHDLFFYGGRHAIKQGNYTANIPEAVYAHLNELLRKSAIEKISSYKNEVFDAPYYTLTIYFNKKEKKIEGFVFPLIIKDLLIFLLNLPKMIESNLNPSIALLN